MMKILYIIFNISLLYSDSSNPYYIGCIDRLIKMFINKNHKTLHKIYIKKEVF